MCSSCSLYKMNIFFDKNYNTTLWQIQDIWQKYKVLKMYHFSIFYTLYGQALPACIHLDCYDPCRQTDVGNIWCVPDFCHTLGQTVNSWNVKQIIGHQKRSTSYYGVYITWQYCIPNLRIRFGLKRWFTSDFYQDHSRTYIHIIAWRYNVCFLARVVSLGQQNIETWNEAVRRYPKVNYEWHGPT